MYVLSHTHSVIPCDDADPSCVNQRMAEAPMTVGVACGVWCIKNLPALDPAVKMKKTPPVPSMGLVGVQSSSRSACSRKAAKNDIRHRILCSGSPCVGYLGDLTAAS